MDTGLTSLKTVTELLELTLPLILVAEIFVLWRQKTLKWNRRTKEIVTNVFSFGFFFSGVLLTYRYWDALFASVSAVLPYRIPTNWFTIVIAVLVADFIYYWEHRLEHEKRGLWALWHSVHHSSAEYDITTSLRLGFFDGLLTTFFYVPMILLGFDLILVLGATAFVVGYQTWLHTELIHKMPRWYEAVFNTPSHHRAHHGADEIYLDKNYGAVLIVWDRIFGTFQQELFRPTYGLTTQIESSHPADVNFSELRGLAKDLRTDSSWLVRWRRLWSRPGWQPSALEPSS